MNREELETRLFLGLGGALLAAGVFLSVGEWATMQQIEAQGLIGQTLNQDAYASAATWLQAFATVAALGTAMVMLGSASYVAETLNDLSD